MAGSRKGSDERVAACTVVTPREEVLWFAERMERKLKANDHKGHWDNCEMGYLSRRLHQEAKELSRALRKLADEIEKAAVYAPIVELATIENVIDEAADCANFSMMIADNARAFLREERDR